MRREDAKNAEINEAVLPSSFSGIDFMDSSEITDGARDEQKISFASSALLGVLCVPI